MLALSVVMLAGSWGLALLAWDRPLRGASLLSLAAVATAFYVGMAMRSGKRDITVRYWFDRRELRRSITRERAQARLHLALLDFVRERDSQDQPDWGSVHRTLTALVRNTFSMLNVSRRGDLAVIVALEANRRYRILHTTTSRSSRWRRLASGKQCVVHGPIEEKLEGLAPHFRVVSAATDSGMLRVAVLSEKALTERDEAFLDALSNHLEVIATRWQIDHAVETPERRLRVVEGGLGH